MLLILLVITISVLVKAVKYHSIMVQCQIMTQLTVGFGSISGYYRTNLFNVL